MKMLMPTAVILFAASMTFAQPVERTALVGRGDLLKLPASTVGDASLSVVCALRDEEEKIGAAAIELLNASELSVEQETQLLSYFIVLRRIGTQSTAQALVDHIEFRPKQIRLRDGRTAGLRGRYLCLDALIEIGSNATLTMLDKLSTTEDAKIAKLCFYGIRAILGTNVPPSFGGDRTKLANKLASEYLRGISESLNNEQRNRVLRRLDEFKDMEL